MSRYHHCSGRPSRQPRPRRSAVVALDVRRELAGSRFTTDVAAAYQVGLFAADLLRTYAPAFFAEYVAALRLTPITAATMGAAWFAFVESRGIPLRWPSDDTSTLDEAVEGLTLPEVLECVDGVSCEWVASEFPYHLSTPRPHYYGIGVQSVLDRIDLEESPDLLSLTHKA